ncbi:MAG: TolC family protein [Nitrospiraceae bacterium]|nr:TolC family protein [Nitrospiraceae bacterium]
MIRIRTNFKKKHLFVLLIPFLALQACAVYRPKPLGERQVAQALAPPNLESIRIKAGEIKHPILKPRHIDFKEGISAEDAAVIAVIANPVLRAERDRRGIARAQLLEAGILPNPVFGYSLDFPTGGSDQGTVNAYGLGLDWDIKSLLTRSARVSAARAAAAQVDLGVAWEEWQVAEYAKLAVYRSIILRKELRVAQAEERELRKNLEAIKKAVAEGNMTVVDLEAVQATVRATHGTVLDIRQRLEQERLGLDRTLGFPPSSRILLEKDAAFPAPKTLPALEDIMRGLEKRRLDLLALRQGYLSREASLRAAVRARFPDIGIGFSHARDTTNVITTGFSVSISLPFFDRNQGVIAIEKASRRQLYDEYLGRVFEARADAAGILANIGAARARALAALKAVQSQEKLVHVSYDGYLEGNIDALSYYNEVDKLTSARLDVLKLEQDLAGLYVALEITAGEYIGTASQ